MRQRFNSKFIDVAFEAAKNSPKLFNASVAATLVYRNRKIICTCTNSIKTHPLQKKFSYHRDAIFLHAENNCIVHALRKGFDVSSFEDCSLYIARASSNANRSEQYANLCRPCSGCQRSIASFGIGRVFYTTLGGVEEF